jgi:hypothetical protein
MRDRRRRVGARAPPQIRLFCVARQVISENAANTPNGGSGGHCRAGLEITRAAPRDLVVG